MRHILPAYFLILLLFTSCATPSVREAREVLAECDSLRAAGQLYADSARLADIVTSLNPIRIFYPHDYAKANYYYGRLLRNRDNYVAAMQCFIDAINTSSHDYEILGRAWSNIGTMCSMEGNHMLSYKMYKKSLENFDNLCDTTSCYYSINDMAYEMSELCDSIQAINLVDSILNYSKSSFAIELALLTKANLFRNLNHYDSAIYYANKSNKLIASKLVKAQSFSHLGVKDSALYYAKIVISSSSEPCKLNNAYYIITNNDENINVQDVQKYASQRADIQKYLEIRQGKLSYAVSLLDQHLNKKTLKSIYFSIIVSLILISIASYITFHIYISRKKTMEEIEYEQHKHQQLKYEEELLELNKSQMEDITNSLKQKYDKLSTEYTQYKQKMKQQIEENAKILKSSHDFKRQLNWSEYDAMCIIINKNFLMLADKLQSLNILNQTEIRLCILVLIGFNRIQIAELLPYSKSGVGKLKDTIAKKLGTSGQNLKNYLIDTAIGL